MTLQCASVATQGEAESSVVGNENEVRDRRGASAMQRTTRGKILCFSQAMAYQLGHFSGPNVVCLHLSHVQDEAELRLLSSDPSTRVGLSKRSRSAKVQLHAVTASCGTMVAGSGELVQRRSWDILVELEARVDKTAVSLATYFERLVKTLLENMLRIGGCREHSKPEGWVVHAIVGDGQPQQFFGR